MTDQPKRCPGCGAKVVWFPKGSDVCQGCVTEEKRKAGQLLAAMEKQGPGEYQRSQDATVASVQGAAIAKNDN